MIPQLDSYVWHMLNVLGVDTDNDENFADTPRRFAEYLDAHFKTSQDMSRLEQDAGIDRTFPSTYKGMITQTHVIVYGMCPHHLLPIEYDISMAYIPQGRVLGLSKLARIAELYGTLAKLQEQVTEDIASTIERVLDGSCKGVAVIISGIHSCMSIRGVRARDAKTTTSVITGAFRDPTEHAREEFFSIVRS